MCRVTTEDLLRYLYHETSKKESAAIKAELKINGPLKEAFDTFVSVHKNLDEVHVSPSEGSFKRITDYANKAINQLHPH
jgi:hypothetical protein